MIDDDKGEELLESKESELLMFEANTNTDEKKESKEPAQSMSSSVEVQNDIENSYRTNTQASFQ